MRVNMFLINDSVDLARDVTKPSEGYFDLGKMLKELIGQMFQSKYAVLARYGVKYIRGSLILMGPRKPR